MQNYIEIFQFNVWLNQSIESPDRCMRVDIVDLIKWLNFYVKNERFLCGKWMIFILLKIKRRILFFLWKLYAQSTIQMKKRSQINIQWIGSESKPNKRKISEKNEKLCKTTVNYTLNIQAIIQIQWNCVRIFFYSCKSVNIPKK